MNQRIVITAPKPAPKKPLVYGSRIVSNRLLITINGKPIASCVMTH